MVRASRHIFGTKRGTRVFLGNLLAAFGGISAVVQFVGQLFPGALIEPGPVTAVSLAACLLWGLIRAYPRSRVHQEFTYPDMTVTVGEGDLFDEDAHLVIGFCDTFDTVVDGVVVNEASVQGQLLRLYDGDPHRLDDELSAALRHVAPISTEPRERKRRGKLNRYAVGTVAVLGRRPRLIFAVAYSRIGNDYVANSSVEELWIVLNRLWDAVYRHGQHERVAMPLIGSGLSRLDFLDTESLLRLILLSFVTRSREKRICRELRIVIQPAELERIDMLEVEAFLWSLGSGVGRP
jgi:hypothetical protein